MTLDKFETVESEILNLWHRRRPAIIFDKTAGFVSRRQVEALTLADWSVVEDVIEVLADSADSSKVRNLLSEGVGKASRFAQSDLPDVVEK